MNNEERVVIKSMPAVCNACGTFFPSGFGVGLAELAEFSGVTSGPCPACGGIGHVPDGVYSISESVIRFLGGPGRSVDEIQRLIRILRAAKEERISQAAAEEAIQRETPQFAPVAETLRCSGRDWLAIASLVVATAELILGLLLQSGDVQINIGCDQVFNYIYEQNEQRSAVPPKEPGTGPDLKAHKPRQPIQPRTPAPQKRPGSLLPRRTEVGRNEKCPCGSGLKFKKCHGSGVKD